MPTDIKHIDELMKNRSLKHSELADIGRMIAESAKSTVIAFIDLADSTSMKEVRNDEEWLGIVFEFLRRLTLHIENARGTVVKRIGDEILATFASVEDSEKLLAALKVDKDFARNKYRVSLDYGNAYHFKFVDGHPDDPYGTVVDRCARISKLGKPNTAVCTYDYFDRLNDTSAYLSMGDFPVKGLTSPVAVYLRSMTDVDSAIYLEPLLQAANKDKDKLDGFKQQGKSISQTDILTFPHDGPRPFIASELLNLPRHPHTVLQMLEERERAADKGEFDARHVGYAVRWHLYFVSYSVQRSYIHALAGVEASALSQLITMILPKAALESVKSLTRQDKIEVRAVLQSFSMGTPSLDYVEIGLL